MPSPFNFTAAPLPAALLAVQGIDATTYQEGGRVYSDTPSLVGAQPTPAGATGLMFALGQSGCLAAPGGYAAPVDPVGQDYYTPPPTPTAPA